MKGKNKKLGKGLEAIFMENTVLEDNSAETLEISLIEPNKDQPRKHFDEEALINLSDSIAQHGVLQPLLVRPLTNGNYQIVAGERRWRACRMAGVTEVPVVIKDLTDIQVLELALIENLQREDLSPVEEAKAYKTLIENCNMTQEEVSKSVGKSRPYITNAMRLLNLPEEVLTMIDKKTLSAGHGRTLLGLKHKEEIPIMAQAVINRGVSVRELENMVKNKNNDDNIFRSERKERESRMRHNDVFFSEVELALNEHLGRKVTITENPEGKGGILQIHFYNQEELADIAQRLAKRRD